jgi:FO synthase
MIDSDGFARTDPWSPGTDVRLPVIVAGGASNPAVPRILHDAMSGSSLSERDIAVLFSGRGGDVDKICEAADELRNEVCGDTVHYVVNRNINYTNVCVYRCNFCAFSKGRGHSALRGKAYDLSFSEVARRAVEAWERGATEVCMQGGINPDYTGDTYVSLLRAVKEAVPQIHVHAFSPLEVHQGAATLEVPIHSFLERLRDAGLGSLPGTAAEILHDGIRQVICPDKLDTERWLEVVTAAHEVGLRTTATVMFGHVESPAHWARHLVRIRDLQARTGGITEFVPLPFIGMEAPIGLRGRARPGPTWREVRLMHAVARLALHPLIRHIQVSWVKLGPFGAGEILQCGADDLGGTLMNESISRAAGAQHGQELPPARMDRLIADIGRTAAQRTTLYRPVDTDRQACSYIARPLTDPEQTPYIKHRRHNAVFA